MSSTTQSLPELPLQHGTVDFIGCELIDGSAYLRYQLRYQQNGAAVCVDMTETIRFPGAPALSSMTPARAAAAQRALTLLHVMAGTSYYKALLPPNIVTHENLSPALAKLAKAVYTEGLAEFGYQNKLTLAPQFASGATGSAAEALALSPRALVAIGGGKDSLVSVEALKRAGIPACAVWIGRSELIAATAKASGLPTLNISRDIAPELFALNAQGALNGHVPVTAINSAILVLAAILYDYKQVIFSNERSASAATLIHEGQAVNHQWSKGADFENALSQLVRAEIAFDLHYFSLLRPLSELAVTQKFAAVDTYDALFSSCNRNFRILGDKPASRWCGQCPKCHFVFLALAPFVAKPRLLKIFGKNLLDEIELAPAFEALLEWNGAHKPFECVGEAQESRAAFFQLLDRADWREDALVQHFAKHIARNIEKPDLAALLTPDADALIQLPTILQKALAGIDLLDSNLAKTC
jgi:UDP-N-acetyl-alpha-D-muramoyl-L-alanyl-L-glutamate epimerase